MATLTDESYRYISDWVRSQPEILADFKSWGLSRSTWRAALQAIENYMVGAFGTRPATSIRAAIEAVTGPTTAARAQGLLASWVAWKFRGSPGGS